MENNYITLPSGRVLQMDDVIYLSNIKIKHGILHDVYQFKITWASRVTETLSYSTIEECVWDWEYIKKNLTKTLLSHDQHTQQIILS